MMHIECCLTVWRREERGISLGADRNVNYLMIYYVSHVHYTTMSMTEFSKEVLETQFPKMTRGSKNPRLWWRPRRKHKSQHNHTCKTTRWYWIHAHKSVYLPSTDAIFLICWIRSYHTILRFHTKTSIWEYCGDKSIHSSLCTTSINASHTQAKVNRHV